MTTSGDPLPEHALRKLLRDAEDLASPDAAPAVPARYEIVREVGRGGMGVVYEAIDTELKRRVAVKVLSLPPGAGPAFRERFAREALAAARLDHPGIVSVHEATEGAIVMRFVDGAPLSSRRDLPRERMVAFVRDAALAVHAAHERGIVHRDLKPQNLLVEGDRVVVTDFGLAKDLGDAAALSLSGHVVGTPAYMSPEQADGRGRDVDERTDVYGLGATLFDLLAGRPPFFGDDVVKCLRRVADEDAPPLRAVAPDVPRDLETIVRKCLEKEKRLRYGSALALAEDLSRYLEGKPIHARRPSFSYRISKLARRHRALVGVGASSAALLLAIALATLAERAQKDASIRALALSSLVSAAQADAESHARLGESEAAAARLDEAIVACEGFLAERDLAFVRLLLGRCERLRGRDAAAMSSLDRALDLDPALVEARMERGLLLSSGLAAAASRRVPPLDPGEEAALPPDLAEVRARAVADLEAAVAALGRLRRVDAAHARAELKRLRGDRVAARRAYEEVQRLDPLHVGARLGLSRLEIAEGNGEAAWHLAMSAIDLFRGFGPAYAARSEAYAAAAEGEGPRDAADSVARGHLLSEADRRVVSGDRSKEALLARGAARLRIEDVEGALADVTSALRADPSDAKAHGHRALVHARNAARLASEGRRDEAIAAWDAAIGDGTSAITIEPDLASAWNNRGVARSERERLLLEAGRVTEAEAERSAAGGDFSAAIERAPRFALAFQNRAAQRRRHAEALLVAREIEEANRALRGAIADVDAALALKPGDPDALLERALALDLDGHRLVLAGDVAGADAPRRAAREAFDAAVLAAPDDARIRGLRGIHRARRGDGAGAIGDLEAALALAPDAKARALFEREIAEARAGER